MGPKIDEKIAQGKLHYSDFLKDIRINNTFFLRPATYKKTSDIILHLESIGPNSLPTFIVKLCTEFFSIYLTKILNISFTTGIFPDLCKLVKVIPIFKKDDPLDCINYRPISLLPVFSKIFEKIIYSRIYEFLELNKFIYNRQFGFRANHSTNHALISMTESIKSFLDSSDCVAGIFIDLKKAFDTVNHQILCNKLNYYGFRGKINDLLKSFLSNRKQFVSINGYDSSCFQIKCGVPQRSTLGPLLLLLYINDLRISLRHAITSHFADDTSIIYASKITKTIETNFNCDLKCVSEWLRSNRLSLNVSKTKLLFFRSKNKSIPHNISIKIQDKRITPSSHVKYLGIFVDEHISWNYHVKELSNKLSRANGIISKLRHYAPKSAVLSVYYALFYSHMTYASLVWTLTSKGNLGQISILQKKCIRLINFTQHNSHTSTLFAMDNLLKFENIITSNKLKLALDFKLKALPHELCNLFRLNSTVHSYCTRSVTKVGFFVPAINSTSNGINTLKYSLPVTWNNFSISNPKLGEMKHSPQLKKFLKDHFIALYNN